MMTKTDYEATADAIRSVAMDEGTRSRIVASLTRTYKNRNPKFNPNKFARLFTDTKD